jgi:tripartite-type tricarboxylate transporter receptor subunit TctC
MFSTRRLLSFVTAIGAAMLLQAVATSAQTYPSRGLRIVTPFAAGAASDIELRFLGDRMSARLQVPVVIENSPGAGGITASRSVLNAPADGYSIAFVGNNTAVGVSLFSQPFDPRNDMVPVVGISEFAYLFVVNENSKYRTLQEIIAAAKAKPNSLNIGTSSVGTSDHLIALLFKSRLDIDFTIVPYRGPSELSVALLRNDIDLFINAYGGLRQALADSRMRALATTATVRLPELPDVPTMKEVGISDFEVKSWNGFYMAKGVPPVAVDTIHKTVTEILAQKNVHDKFREIGFEARALTPEQFDQRMRADIDRWGKVLTAAGIAKQ